MKITSTNKNLFSEVTKSFAETRNSTLRQSGVGEMNWNIMQLHMDKGQRRGSSLLAMGYGWLNCYKTTMHYHLCRHSLLFSRVCLSFSICQEFGSQMPLRSLAQYAYLQWHAVAHYKEALRRYRESHTIAHADSPRSQVAVHPFCRHGLGWPYCYKTTVHISLM